MYSRVPKFVSWVLALAFVAFMPLVVAAQDSAKPSTTAGGDPTPSQGSGFARVLSIGAVPGLSGVRLTFIISAMVV